MKTKYLKAMMCKITCRCILDNLSFFLNDILFASVLPDLTIPVHIDDDIEKVKATNNVDFSRCRRKRAKNDPYIRAYADMNLPAPVKYCEDFMRSTNHFISLDVL